MSLQIPPKLDQDTREKRIKETDRLTVLMCQECGLDMYEYVRIYIGDDMTPYDAMPLTFTIASHQMNFQTETCMVQQWRKFRQHAYQALAYQRAFDKFMLTET